MTNAEQKARQMIKNLSMKALLEQWALTEVINDANIPMVRGWLMDELEARNPEAFDKWIDDYEAAPDKYFA